MNPSSDPTSNSQQPESNTTEKHIGRTVLAVLGILVVLGLVGYGVYTWQHNQVTQLNNQINDLNKQVADLKKTTTTTVVTTEAAYKVPANYLEYTVTKPNFSFAYPKGFGVLELTTQDLNTKELKAQGAKGTAITIGPKTRDAKSSSSLRMLIPSNDYTPLGGDDPLLVFTSAGYVKVGSRYNVPINGTSDLRSYPKFEVVKTRNGEGVVFDAPVAEGGGENAVGIVNLPASSGYKAIGIITSSMDELKSIMATIKVGS